MKLSFTHFVQIEEARNLSLRMRVAWAASVCEGVLSLYSPYFCTRFLQQDALEVAWEHALGGDVDQARCADLLEQLEGLLPEAEDEDYGRHALFPGMLLLTEILGGERDDSVPAVNNAALLFAAHHIYRQGIGSFDPLIPREYEAELEVVCHRYARAMFDAAKDLVNQPIKRGMLEVVRLTAEVPRLDPAVIDRARTRPPIHEAEFIRDQGWGAR